MRDSRERWVRGLCWLEISASALVIVAGVAVMVMALLAPMDAHGGILPALGGLMVCCVGCVPAAAGAMTLEQKPGWVSAQLISFGIVLTIGWLAWIARDA